LLAPKLYAWLENNERVSYAWISINKEHFVGELSKVFKFEEKVNFIIDCFTPDENRKKGYYSSGLSSLKIPVG